MKFRKSQSALEFLLTYGWAFMIILTVIGGLAYLGLTNPNLMVAKSCILEEPFHCDDFIGYYASSSNGMLRLRLLNGVGLPINVTNASVKGLSGDSSDCVMSSISPGNYLGGNSFPLSVAAGKYFELNMSCGAGQIMEGAVLRADFSVDYVVDKPGYFEKSLTGLVVFGAESPD